MSLLSLHKQTYHPALLGATVDHCLQVWPEMPDEWRDAIGREDYSTLNRLSGPTFNASSFDEWVEELSCAVMHVNNAGFGVFFRLAQVLLARRVLARHRNRKE